MPGFSTPVSIKPSELPVPSESAFRVVRACNQDGVGAQELGALVECDPVLVAEVLRIANSAYFGFAREVTSVARAITVIGQRVLRNLVLCVAMRGTFKSEQVPALPIAELWESALRRAVCARVLAAETAQDVDTCFTVGLLQDFGLLLLFYLQPNRVFEWPRLLVLTPDERYGLEAQLFGTTHDEVGRQLAEAWNLPAEFVVAMGFHHQAPPEKTGAMLVRISETARCADWMAAVFTSEECSKRSTVQSCHSLLASGFDLTVTQVDDLLGRVSEDMEEAAAAFGFDVGPQTSYASVMQKANLQLLDQHLSMQELNLHLERAVEERDRATAQLREELELAREVQRGLFPQDAGGLCGIVGLNVSARAVSGDFYDFFRLHDGRIAFCIADVSGKGMHAALLMAKASSLFHCLGKMVHDPGKLLTILNREIAETSIRGMFITMVGGVVDPESTRVILANAGHLPALRLRAGRKVEQYAASAPPLGIVSDVTIPNHEFSLDGDSLYICTDGLFEAKVNEQQQLGEAGLVRLLARHTAVTPSERLKLIVADIPRRDADGGDDMTILLIESGRDNNIQPC